MDDVRQLHLMFVNQKNWMWKYSIEFLLINCPQVALTDFIILSVWLTLSGLLIIYAKVGLIFLLYGPLCQLKVFWNASQGKMRWDQTSLISYAEFHRDSTRTLQGYVWNPYLRLKMNIQHRNGSFQIAYFESIVPSGKIVIIFLPECTGQLSDVP